MAEQRKTAIDDERLSVDPTGAVGAEKRDDLGDIVWLTQAPSRREPCGRILHLLVGGKLPQRIRIDRSA